MKKEREIHRDVAPETSYQSKEFDLDKFLKQRNHPTGAELLLALREEMDKEPFFEMIGRILLNEVKDAASQIQIEAVIKQIIGHGIKAAGAEILKRSGK